MTWQGLSAYVRALWERARTMPRTGALREDAAALALGAYGVEDAMARPALLNVSALALSVAARPVVHDIRPAVARTVDATDLHSVPGEPPTLLRGAWILESRDPEREQLVADTPSVAGYPLDGAIYLVGLGYPDGARVARWVPHWTGGDLASALPDRDASPLIDDVDAHRDWARSVARFAIVLGLLLDAHGSPVRSRDEEERPKRRAVTTGNPPPPWTVRHISVTGSTIGHGSGAGAADGASPGEREAIEVPVRGHLKRQPHGPGGSMRRWIYVEGYEARRWVAPRPVRVVVS